MSNDQLLIWAKGTAILIREASLEATLPPQEGVESHDQRVLNKSFTVRTKNYIERTVEQVNQTYEIACYDACAVMVRRLVETLIIECFESKGIAAKIKGTDGNFLFLSDLIAKMVEESDTHGKWNLTRNAKDGLKCLKKKGDLSAHTRSYLAHRTDIDDIKDDLRVVVQELVSIAGIQRSKK